MKPNLDHLDHRGRFVISNYAAENLFSEVLTALKDVLIYRCEQRSLDLKGYECYGISPKHFRKLDAGEATPEYMIEMTRVEDSEDFTTSFKEVAP